MIVIKKLNKTYNYKKQNAFQALKDVSLSINNGEMVALIGTSGAGKSTLMHIIGCIDRFESGEYYLDDIKIHGISEAEQAKIRNQKVGIIMQDFALVENYSAIENVMIPLYFSKNTRGVRKKALKSLEMVGIGDLSKKPVSKLSGGQKQRVAIARALVNNPSILLADEPTGALDSNTSEDILKVFKDLNKEGKTLMIITHDKNVAEKCGRVIEIIDGSIKQ